MMNAILSDDNIGPDLHQRQTAFARAVAELIAKAFELGYEVTLGEAYRTAEQAAWNAEHGTGVKNSLHTQRLAIDLNIFKQRVLLKDGALFSDLGSWWESIGGTWGQRFTKIDGNHFSFAWRGVK